MSPSAPRGGSPLPAFPKYSEEAYLAEQEDVREAVARGELADGFTHYLHHGVDENRSPRLARDAVAMAGNLETCFVGETGCMALLGWLADEGRGETRWTLSTEDFRLEIPTDAVFRFARKDVEAAKRDRCFDYGFLALAGASSATLLQQKSSLRVDSRAGAYDARVVPEIIADAPLLDLVINHLTAVPAHRGAMAAIYEFLAGPAGRTLTSLFRAHVARHIEARYVESFRPRRVERSFVTVLAESAEPILLQPLLFQQQGVRGVEWVYVCNGRREGDAALRSAQMMAELYDVMITVVVMDENVGFSAAANVAVAAAHSSRICILSPDVYPSPEHSAVLRDALAALAPGDRLIGGLLFHDAGVLAQSGLYFEREAFLNQGKLARLSAFNNGTLFEPAQWRTRKIVPVVSNRLMAFERDRFESLGGFSSDYLYEGYEDADLALRWAAKNGPPVVEPGLRLALVEASPSLGFAETLRSARILNRCLFWLRYGAAIEADPAAMTTMREDG